MDTLSFPPGTESESCWWPALQAASLAAVQGLDLREILPRIGEELRRARLDCAVVFRRDNSPFELIYTTATALQVGRPEKADSAVMLPLQARWRECLAAGESKWEPDGNPRLTALFGISPQSSGTVLSTPNAMITSPVVAGEHTSAVLLVWGSNLAVKDTGPCSLLARQLCLAMESADLRAVDRKRAAQLELVSRIAGQGSTISNPQDLLQYVVRQIQATTGHYSVAVLLNHPETRTMKMAAIAGAFKDLLPQYTQSWETGLVGLVVRTDRPAWSNDVARDGSYVSPLPGPDPIRSELAVPLKQGARLVGVLDLQSTWRGAFDQGDVAAMETLAEQVAGAFERAHLLVEARRRAEELTALREAALALVAERDTERLLNLIVERAVALVGADGGTLYTVDESRRELVNVVSHHMVVDHRGMRLRWGEGLAGQVALRGEAMFVDDYASWPGRSPKFDRDLSHAVLSVPLAWQGRILGVLNLARSRGAHFTTSDSKLAALFAAQVALALNNVRFQTHQERQLEIQHGLLDLSTRFLETTDPAEVAALAASTAARLLNLDVVVVSRRDSQGILAPTGQYARVSELQHDWTEVTRELVRSGAFQEDRFVEWNDRDPENVNLAMSQILEWGFHMGVAVPMSLGERSLGVITGNAVEPRRLEPHERRGLILLANQSAVALERARLWNEAQLRNRRLALLNQISLAIASARELGDILNTSVRELCLVLKADRTGIAVLDESREFLTVLSEYRRDGGASTTGRRVQMDHDRAIEMILRDPQPLMVGDVRRSDLFGPASEILASADVLSILLVPMIANGQVTGTIVIDSLQEVREFTPDEIELSQTVAQQAASAIEKARLYDAAQDRLKESQALAVENARLYEQTRSEAEVKAALLRELSHRVKNNLTAIASLLYLALDRPELSREEILSETISRMQSMAAAHSLLSESTQGRAALFTLARRVIHDAVRQLAPPDSRFELEIQGDEVQITSRQVTSLALILNELVTNALTHGYDQPQGRFTLRVRSEAGRVVVEFHDDGKGLARVGEALPPEGLGLTLIRALVEKDLQGTFALEPADPGTVARFSFLAEG